MPTCKTRARTVLPLAGLAQGTARPAIDEVCIHLVPLLLGEGMPLFAGERAELIRTGYPWPGAVTYLRYRVAKP
jgi:hypothetical protein